MRTARTTAIAGALVFFELLAPKAMAGELQPLDLTKCGKIIHMGKYHICPKFVPGIDLVLLNEQFEALKEVPAPTTEDIKAARKALEATPAPDSTK